MKAKVRVRACVQGKGEDEIGAERKGEKGVKEEKAKKRQPHIHIPQKECNGAGQHDGCRSTTR